MFKQLLSGVVCGSCLLGIASTGAASGSEGVQACGNGCEGIVICEWVNVPCGSTPEGGNLYCLEWRCVEDCRDCSRPGIDDILGPGGLPDIPGDFPFDPPPFPF